jgi:poly-gamma-glutamate capsule biosynthesis protein CapA/YwtB (metallophosphatase superfamily)
VPFDYSPSLKSFFLQHDLRLCNLEGSFSDNKNELFKAGAYILLKEECFDRITDVFNVVSLANNHTMDYGAEGLEKTINLCKNSGVQTVGAGLDKAEAFKPIIAGNCSLIAVAENEFGAAGNFQAGIATVDNELEIYQLISEQKKLGHFVVVVAHGGSEVIEVPPPYIRQRYKLWIEYGADLIIGSHPHVVQGCEVYKGRFIFYSLGNFAFFSDSFKQYPDSQWSIAVSVDTKNCNVKVFTLSAGRDRIIDFVSMEEINRRFHYLCGIPDSPQYENLYRNFASELYMERYGRLKPKDKYDAALLLHYFRCDAHKNMIQAVLSHAINESDVPVDKNVHITGLK